MNSTPLIFTKEDGIARITVNRPEARNALNKAVRQALRDAVEDIRNDKSIRVVIIAGEGKKAFIAGADIVELKDMTPLQVEEFAGTLGQQLYTDIESLEVPVVAKIDGFCLGGGCEIAMACDVRIASENSKFGQPEINIGIIPGGGGTQRLPRLIGWGRAKELIYSGRIIDAAEAERIGLVDKVVPESDLDKTVGELVDSVKSKSPLTMRLAKKSINRGMYTDLAAGLSAERSNLVLCFATEDQKEGMSAFLEKRKPSFKGQ
ncbi:MAG: enoyl-CoA hydratase/isomerase family protein [Dehalococcoidia bacterium]|nr:enoyl-CoA hydratase/isomerase family protein [Dehalococcoidia bacterium]